MIKHDLLLMLHAALRPVGVLLWRLVSLKYRIVILQRFSSSYRTHLLLLI